MKLSVKAIFVILMMALSVFACTGTEDILISQEGNWRVTSLTTKVFENQVLISDITKTDSLGQMTFERKGSGYKTDYAGQTETFVWSYYPKDKKLTIYWKVGPYADATVTKSTKTSMTIVWSNLTVPNGVIDSTEITMSMEHL